MRYFIDFGSFPGALRKSGCRYTNTFCGRIFIAIFAKVTENECIMLRRSHVSDFRHYKITYSLLQVTTFNFNYKSDFPMMKMFVNFRRQWRNNNTYNKNWSVVISSLNVVNLFQHITASICGGIYARVCCILYCLYDVVVGKTTESDRLTWWRFNTAVLPSRKESSRSLSHLLMSFLFIKPKGIFCFLLFI